MTPTEQLLQKMAGYDLHPRTILWDGRRHRFPGAKKKRGTDAWYIAYPDRQGAHFGDWSSGAKDHWVLKRDKPPSEKELRKWRDEKDSRDRERAEKRKEALEQVNLVWKKGEKPDPVSSPTPYLSNKDIQEYRGLKVSTLTQITGTWKVPAGLLLIPMYRAGRLVNIQRIWPNGQKRFWPGAEVIGARHTIGLDLENPDFSDVSVAEGWASGYTVHKATNRPVIVAFSAGGLRHVCEALRREKNPDRMLIAADNDRWSRIVQAKGEDIPNPGVYWAKVAAEASGAEVAIPDFEDLDGNPVDFDDLRIREGMDAVGRWLDPKMADKATTVAERKSTAVAKTGKDAKPPAEPGEGASWRDTAPFRPLGHNMKVCYFASKLSGQILAVTTADFRRSSEYYHLARRAWWRKHFKQSKKPGFDMDWAADELIASCMAEGVFDEGRYRGRGAWLTEEGAVVMHWGDRILAPGAEKYTTPEQFVDGARIYPRLPRLAGAAMLDPLKAEESERLLGLFESLPWENEASGSLLAGWVVLSFFAGCLPFRPHVWINGPTQCGKSTILNRVVGPLLACTQPVTFEAHSTSEAAVRQTLRGDALPVILDEADMVRGKARSNLRGLFDLARSSSTGGVVGKGSPGGKAVDYAVRSTFLFSSIVVGLQLEQDKNRMAVLTLKSPREIDPDKRREHWAWFQKEMVGKIDQKQGQRLLARTVDWFRSGRFDKLLRVCTKAAFSVLRTARAGELYGALAAGSWTMRSDDIPSEEEVVAWMKDAGVGVDHTQEEAVQHSHECLGILLQATVPVMRNSVIQQVVVGQLLDLIAGQSDDIGVKKSDAIAALKERGLRVDDRGIFVVANTSVWVRKLMERTQYEGGWLRVLRALPEAEAGDKMRFYPGMKSRVTRIPLKVCSVSTLSDVAAAPLGDRL